ncbi:MAG: hypothetical protein JO033_04830 [Acidobacteriaceae bacterium]|nr:hypothetical protein [Acidobacteriaceae bacterium]MBV9179854.1 hypothetical protein [Acidobacteriota bacterium]
MFRDGKAFVADWKDSLGRRRRRWFHSESEALRHEHLMAAQVLSVRVGERMRKAANTERELMNLAKECARIAQKVSLGQAVRAG